MKRTLHLTILTAALTFFAVANSAQAVVIITDANTSLDWIVLDQEGMNDGDGNFVQFPDSNPPWERQVLGGNSFNGIGRRSAGGQGEATATWTYNNLEDGVYEVAGSWQTRGGEATNAPFSINGGDAILVNQRSNSSGGPTLADLGGAGGGINDIFFETLSFDTIVDAGSLTVFLTNNADGRVLADAFAIRKVADLTGVPEPATATLALVGLGGLVMRRRRNAA